MIYNFPAHINNDTFDGVTFNLKVDGSPVDLTDCVIKMQLKKQPSLTAILELSTESGIEIVHAVNGVFKVSQQIISVATPDQYKYDIQITFPDEKVRTYIEGVWLIKADITQ